MEYVDGGTLALARLDPRALVRTIRGVVDALGHAHESGIVHRDVKPANVLLDRRGRAVLTDFGLALGPDEGSGLGVSGRPIVGTPLAMSPEQVAGEETTHASDVFSLGTTLYRQLTGEWPFRGRTVSDVMHAIRSRDPACPTTVRPEVPRALADVVLRCLAKRPDQRYGSMAELGSELDAFLDRRSVFARAAELFRGRRRARPSGPRIHPEELS